MGSTCTGTGVSAGALAEAIRSAVARKTPAEALAEVIGMAVNTGPCEAASITMCTGNTVESVAYSGELIRQADALLYELGEGPCLDAVSVNANEPTHGAGTARLER